MHANSIIAISSALKYRAQKAFCTMSRSRQTKSSSSAQMDVWIFHQSLREFEKVYLGSDAGNMQKLKYIESL